MICAQTLYCVCVHVCVFKLLLVGGALKLIPDEYIANSSLY